MALQNFKLLTAEEMYPLLGFQNAQQLREAARRKQVPSVRIGIRLRFDPRQIESWAANGGTPLGDENQNGTQDQAQSLATAA